MILLSIGDQVEPGDYALHSRFNRAVNFTNGRRLVFLVDETIGAGPLSIVLKDLRTARNTSYLHVRPHAVAFGNQQFQFTGNQYYDSRLKFDRWKSSRFQRNVAVLREQISVAAPPRSLAFLIDRRCGGDFKPGFEKSWAGQIACGVDRVFQGNLLSGIDTLKGCGWGLTPGGDDFIAGLLFGLDLLERLHEWDFQKIKDTIFKTAVGSNLFSNTFLDLARRGLYFGKMKDLVMALVQGGEDSVRTSAKKLFTLGSTSGADVATGFLMTVEAEDGRVSQWAERAKEMDRSCLLPSSNSLAQPVVVETEAGIS